MIFRAKNEILEDFRVQLATFAIEKDGKVAHREFGRGIAPVIAAFDTKKELLRNSCVYDTIVGKAAAAVFVLSGVRAVYGETMSQSAMELLRQNQIVFEYQEKTEQIINRRGDGLCPFEQAVLSCQTAEQCLPIIRETMARLKNS